MLARTVTQQVCLSRWAWITYAIGVICSYAVSRETVRVTKMAGSCRTARLKSALRFGDNHRHRSTVFTCQFRESTKKHKLDKIVLVFLPRHKQVKITARSYRILAWLYRPIRKTLGDRTIWLIG